MKTTVPRAMDRLGSPPWPPALFVVLGFCLLGFQAAMLSMLTVRFDLESSSPQPVFTLLFSRGAWSLTLGLLVALLAADAWEVWTRRSRSRPRLVLSVGGALLTGVLWMALLPWIAAGEQQGPAERIFTILDRSQGELDRALPAAPLTAVSAAVILPGGRCLDFSAGGSLSEDMASGEEPYFVPARPRDQVLSTEIGRSFVWKLAMGAVSEGRLDLEDALADHLAGEPWFTRLPGADRLRVGHLLRQRSGIPSYRDQPAFQVAFRERPNRFWAAEELLGYVLDLDLLFEPGEEQGESETDSVLAVLVLEQVFHETIEILVNERIRRPHRLAALGLVDVTGDLRKLLKFEGEQSWHRVPGQVTAPWFPGMPRSTELEFGMFSHPGVEGGTGACATTAPALARWAKIFFDGTAAGSPWAKARPSPHGPMHLLEGRSLGYGAAMAYFPESDISVGIGLNTDDPKALGMSLGEFCARLGGIAIEEIERE